MVDDIVVGYRIDTSVFGSVLSRIGIFFQQTAEAGCTAAKEERGTTKLGPIRPKSQSTTSGHFVDTKARLSESVG